VDSYALKQDKMMTYKVQLQRVRSLAIAGHSSLLCKSSSC
jgi:hypothetical protein